MTTKIADVLTWNNEYYIDKEGVAHETVEDYIGSLLGFCGCGDPHAALIYVHAILTHIHTRNFEALDVCCPDEGIKYFTYYTLSAQKLLNHGSSVPGWLTHTGELVLDLLEESLQSKLKE